jgi:hypothetical protein
MIGRSCRSRGVCEGTLYINTGEDEASYNSRISTTDYNKTMDFVELLIHLSAVQKNPTEPSTNKRGKLNPKK